MIDIEEVSKLYGQTPVVDSVSLRVAKGEICVVVGASGSGKTTLIRMINRLVEPSQGMIRIAGRDTREFEAYQLRRRIGYVIQGHGLFPHRSVAQNIATVPRLLGWEQARIRSRVDELLTLFQLDPHEFRDRLPNELSGGQQQRVGVARALAAKPDILLMDEPFGALDPIIRGKAQADLLAIQRQSGITIMLVTHDMNEAIDLGDRIAVMDKGRLLQFASSSDIIARPASSFVESLIGKRDRPFQLLSLDIVLHHIEPGDAGGAAIDSHATLRDAYAECLWSRRKVLPVELEGKRIGCISLSRLTELAAEPK